MKTGLYLILAGLMSLFIAGSGSESEIHWDEKRLGWTDFKSVRSNGSSFKAQTYSGIRYTLREKNGGVFVDVVAYFVPEESWVVKGSETPYLLRHEQLHFDITELYARKLRKELEPIQGTSSAEFRSNRLYRVAGMAHDRLYDEMVAVQEAYDEETDHSLRRKAQEEWDRKINAWLAELDDYRSGTSP